MNELILGIKFMTNIIEEVVEAVKEVLPDAPIVEAVEAVIETIANPTPAQVLSDLQLAERLVSALKDTHPKNILDILKTLL